MSLKKKRKKKNTRQWVFEVEGWFGPPKWMKKLKFPIMVRYSTCIWENFSAFFDLEFCILLLMFVRFVYCDYRMGFVYCDLYLWDLLILAANHSFMAVYKCWYFDFADKGSNGKN